MSELKKVKELSEARDLADDVIMRGIVAVEAALKELSLGIPLFHEIVFHGHLEYKKHCIEKPGGRPGNGVWRLLFNNAKYHNDETVIPLVNCSRQIRALAAAELPMLIESAARTLEVDLVAREKAKQGLNIALQRLQVLNATTHIPEE